MARMSETIKKIKKFIGINFLHKHESYYWEVDPEFGYIIDPSWSKEEIWERKADMWIMQLEHKGYIITKKEDNYYM